MSGAPAGPNVPNDAPPAPVVPGLWDVSFGFVHAYLLADDDAADAPLTLIDTGMPGSAPRLLGAVAALGRRPEAVRWIVATHLHIDHTGSLAEVQRATGAEVIMHPADAELIAQGLASRPMQPAPTPESRAWIEQMRGREARVEPVVAAWLVGDGDELPCGGGVRVVHAPGHTAGQIALLWPRHGGVLVAADALGNRGGRLGWSVGYEDVAQGVATVERLAGLPFDAAVFGHGEPLVGGADAAFRGAMQETFRPGSA